MGKEEVVWKRYIYWGKWADEQLFRLLRPRSSSLGSSFGCSCGLLNGASDAELAEAEKTYRRRIPTIHPGGRWSICQQCATPCDGHSLSPSPAELPIWQDCSGPSFAVVVETKKGQVRISCVKTVSMHVYIWLYVP